MSEIMNENVSCASDDGALNNKECGEKMFTQSQLEEIISERLSRERKVNQSLSAVKTLLKGAADKGLIKGSSYAEMANELVERLKKSSENPKAEAEAQEPQSLDDGTDVADAAATETTDAQEMCGNDGTEENDEKGRAEETDSFSDILYDIKARYPKQAVEMLFSGDLFERFAKGRQGSTKEIVDDFFDFVESAGISNVKNDDDDHSSFASTAFSSQSGSGSAGTNLSKQQMEIAKSAGMSYREYQSLLESIPKRTGRTF